jgi:hypothetical protein
MPAPDAPYALPSADDIRSVTQEVLSRPEFQPRSAWPEWLSHIQEWLRQHLHDVTHWLQGHPTLKWVLFGLLMVLLLLLLAHLTRLVWQETRPVADHRSRGLSPHPVNGTADAAPKWETVLQDVRRALKQGDRYQAIWRSHRFVLAVLDQQGVLTFQRWKTNADYVRECSTTHPAFDLLVWLSRLYDQIVYAHRDVPLDTLTGVLERIEHDQHRLQT